MKRIVWAVTFATLLTATPAWPCDNPYVTSPKDLVRLADVIVRARAVTEHNSSVPITSSILPPSREVEFSIVTVLKGAFSDRTVRIPGYLDERDDWNDNPDGSNPQPRRGFWVGSCVKNNYRQGADYLLFLATIPRPTPYWLSQARTNEQIRGDDDPWLVWVIGELRR